MATMNSRVLVVVGMSMGLSLVSLSSAFARDGGGGTDRALRDSLRPPITERRATAIADRTRDRHPFQPALGKSIVDRPVRESMPKTGPARGQKLTVGESIRSNVHQTIAPAGPPTSLKIGTGRAIEQTFSKPTPSARTTAPIAGPALKEPRFGGRTAGKFSGAAGVREPIVKPQSAITPAAPRPAIQGRELAPTRVAPIPPFETPTRKFGR